MSHVSENTEENFSHDPPPLILLMAEDITRADNHDQPGVSHMCNSVNRHFYKCPLCLCVAAVDAPHQQAITCGHCSEPMEYMGRVYQDRLVKDKTRCACDERCTSARGPKCDCHCGGMNHGTNAVVHVRIECGKVVAEVKPTAKQVTEAREYIATRDEAREAYRNLNAQGYLPYEQFIKKLRLERELAAAKKSRTHAARMRHLAAAGFTPTRKALPTPAAPVASSEALVPVTTAKAGCLF